MDCTSIMLVTYNRLELTKRMLKNFFETTDCAYRLIVIDNGSTDGTIEYLQKLTTNDLCQTYDFQLNKENMGIGIGRNQALLIADKYQDKWLCTLDNDIELPAKWLSKCIKVMEKNPDFSIGVNMEHVPYPIINMNEENFQLKEAGNLGSACMVFDRKLHDLIGFFTTEYECYGHEDADWGFRSRASGYKIGYIEEMGNHFGQGELDSGEYREFKNKYAALNLPKFINNCYNYSGGGKDKYIDFI